MHFNVEVRMTQLENQIFEIPDTITAEDSAQTVASLRSTLGETSETRRSRRLKVSLNRNLIDKTEPENV